MERALKITAIALVLFFAWCGLFAVVDRFILPDHVWKVTFEDVALVVHEIRPLEEGGFQYTLRRQHEEDGDIVFFSRSEYRIGQKLYIRP